MIKYTRPSPLPLRSWRNRSVPDAKSVASGENRPSPVGSSSSSFAKTRTVTGSAPSQLSTAVALSPTFTRSWFGGPNKERPTEEVTTGGSISRTVTVNEHEPLATLEQVTVVVPTG